MLKGLKKAVGEYKRANAGGQYCPRYGRLMLDRGTGELWTDEFYSLGHNNWKEYRDDAVVDLVRWANRDYIIEDEKRTVSMKNIKGWAELAISEYEKENVE